MKFKQNIDTTDLISKVLILALLVTQVQVKFLLKMIYLTKIRNEEISLIVNGIKHVLIWVIFAT